MHAGMAPNHLHDMTLGGALGAEVFGQSKGHECDAHACQPTIHKFPLHDGREPVPKACVVCRVGLPRADGALLKGHRTLHQLPIPQGELIEQCISMPLALLCYTRVERPIVCLPGTNMLTLTLPCASPVTMSYRFLAR